MLWPLSISSIDNIFLILITRGNPERKGRERRRTEERKNTEMQKHKQSQTVQYAAKQCNEEEESWRWKNHTFDVEVWREA